MLPGFGNIQLKNTQFKYEAANSEFDANLGFQILRECLNNISLVLQIPFQKVLDPKKPAQNTLSEGSWSTRV